MTRLTLLGVLCLSAAASAQLSAQQRARCATRLSINVLGTAPSSTLLSAANPQTQVDAMLVDPVFIERFASFINSKFNSEASFPGYEPNYYLAQLILTNNKPWKDLFTGHYKITRHVANTLGYPPDIVEDPTVPGLGYFGSLDWRIRYQGNELNGYRLVHAYRLINNTLGIQLVAAVNTNGVSSNGRQSMPCAQCHYNTDYGLDLIARVLPLKNGTPPNDAPQTLLGGQVITDEEAMVAALVATPDFKYNACRLAMTYAYGRDAFQCEGPVFDACMSAFSAAGTIQSALSAVLKHPTYCQ
jgi:hypothetical protein